MKYRNIIIFLSIILIILLGIFIYLFSNNSISNKESYLLLKGNSKILLLKGNAYVEKGATGYDSKLGDVTSKIIIEGEVDSNNIGEYIINYSFKDSSGNIISKERMVIVYDFIYDISVKRENNRIKLFYKRESDYIKSISINSVVYNDKEINLEFDDDIELFIKIIDVNNNVKDLYYDFKYPNVTCNAIITDTSTSVSVSGLDNSKINKYIYYIDNNRFESSLNTYNYSKFSSKIEVEVVDDNLNSKRNSCKITDNRTAYNSGLKACKITDSSCTSTLIDKKTCYSMPNYYLYVPDNVKKGDRYPLVIFLSGIGEGGDNLSKIDKFGFSKYIKEGKKYNSFILMPQLLDGVAWGTIQQQCILSLLDIIVKEYNINDKKISISGFSLGANGVVRLMENNSHLFSATAILAMSNGSASKANYFKNTPTWIFYGENDYYSSTTSFYNALKAINSNTNLTVFPKMGHNIVDNVFKDDKVFNWLTSFEKK